MRNSENPRRQEQGGGYRQLEPQQQQQSDDSGYVRVSEKEIPKTREGMRILFAELGLS